MSKYVIAKGSKRLSDVYLNGLGSRCKYIFKDADRERKIVDLPYLSGILTFRTNSYYIYDTYEKAVEDLDYCIRSIQGDDRYTDKIKISLCKSIEKLKGCIVEID